MGPSPAPDLDLRSLQWSLIVARLGGFRRAAHALGVEQSAVSRRVRDLEDDLGVSLFQRGPGGAVATHAGRAFLQRVDALVGGLAAAVAEARDAGAGQVGRLRIGVSFSLVSDSLFELIRRFHAAHPRVRIEMIEGRASAHLEAVADRRLDVAVLPGGMTVAGLDMSVLWRERVLIALPAHCLGAVWLGAAWSVGLAVTTDRSLTEQADLERCVRSDPFARSCCHERSVNHGCWWETLRGCETRSRLVRCGGQSSRDRPIVIADRR